MPLLKLMIMMMMIYPANDDALHVCLCEESFRVIAKEEGEEKYLISLGLSRKDYSEIKH